MDNTEQKSSPELTIVDLQNLKSVIEVCARRGAFQAQEMAAIGTVFNKLSTFLDAVAPKQEEEKEEAEAA